MKERGKMIRTALQLVLLTLLLATAGGLWWKRLSSPIGKSVTSIQEPLPESAQIGSLLSSGNFIHANPKDQTHYGRGGARVFEHLVRLEKDFMVGPGPAYHLYLVKTASFLPGTDLKQLPHIDLGSLKAFQGGQNYTIPAWVDPSRYGSLVVWCDLFGILISPASLESTESTAPQ